MERVTVQTEAFDAGAIIDDVRRDNPKVGAVTAFVGLVRDINDARGVARMTLEHYPGMTERSIEAIIDEAASRWEVLDARVVHRVGPLEPTDPIVLVAVASGHRRDAFEACEFIMDYLKTRAPFWKKEETDDGSRWVASRESDTDAAKRWER